MSARPQLDPVTLRWAAKYFKRRARINRAKEREHDRQKRSGLADYYQGRAEEADVAASSFTFQALKIEVKRRIRSRMSVQQELPT